jgi:hypothetical protein
LREAGTNEEYAGAKIAFLSELKKSPGEITK